MDIIKNNQTKAWCKGVECFAEFKIDEKLTFGKLANTFAEKLDRGVLIDAVNWCRYSNGKPTPTPKTRSLVEANYPGTLDIFEYGPEFSFLWSAMSYGDPKSVINSISDTWTNGKIIQILINVDGFQVLKHRIIPEKLFKRVKLDRDGSLDLINIPLCIIDQNCIAQIHEELFNPTKFNTQFNILENLESTIYLDQIKLPELAQLSLKIANARLDKKSHISLEYEPSHLEIYDLTLENISTITGIHFYINN